MSYKTIQIEYNNKITKIYHISDIHIHLQAKHNEYKIVFDRLFKYLEKCKNEKSIIVITGDILHSKTELLPECIELTRYFLTECSKIMTTIIIAGNHDLNINNEDRLDGLTPITNGIPKKYPLYYFNESGLYYFSNIVFSVVSVRDYLIIDPDEIPNSSNKLKICLYHGRVNGAELFNKTLIDGEINKKTNKTITKESFNGYDYVLMGDIHKYQFIKENTAYSGSLIQQNHGETLEKHGVLIWDLVNNNHSFQEIKNDFCYFTYKIENEVLDGTEIEKLDIPKNVRLRLLLSHTLNSKIQEYIATFKQYFNILEVSYKEYDTNKSLELNNDINLNITDVDYQNKLIEEILLKDPDITRNTINNIKILNKLANETIEKQKYINNSHWKLLKLEFSNLFSYSEKNVIDFSDTKGVLGIIAPNHMGKSAIIDIILFTLYDKFPRKGNVKDIINNRKNTFKSKITLKIGKWKYIIEKSGTKTNKNRVTSKINFYRINKDNIKQLLDENSMVDTKNMILKYIGSYEDIIQTNVSLQNNNCNFIEAENTARKKELERILQVHFIEDLIKKSNIILIEKNAIYKHLQENCYEEKIISLNKEIKLYLQNIKKLNIQEQNLSALVENYSSKINNLISNININIEKDLETLQSNLKTDNPLEEIETNKKTIKEYIIEIQPLDNEIVKMSYKDTQKIKKQYEEENEFFNKTKIENIIQFDKNIEVLNKSIINLNFKFNHNKELEESNKKLKVLNLNKKQYNDIKNKLEQLNKEKENVQNNIDKNNIIIKKINLQTIPEDMIEYIEEFFITGLKEDLEKEIENNNMQNICKLSEKIGIYNYLEDYIYKEEENQKIKEDSIENDKKYNKEKNNITKQIKDLQTLKINDKIIEDCLKLNDKIDKIKQDIENKEKNYEFEKKIEKIKENKNNCLLKENEKYIEFIKIFEINENNNRLKKEIETLNIKNDYLNTNIENYDKLLIEKKNNDRLNEKINNLKTEKLSKQEELKKITLELNICKTHFTSFNTKLNTHKEEITKMLVLEKEINIYSIYIKILKQLPYIIIKKVVPRLEKKINDLLSVSTDFIVKIMIENNKIEIYLDRPIYNGSLILLNNASGFERFISSLAIRLGLISISQLPKPNFIAIDEGWTSFDYQNINNVSNIFDILRDNFDFIISISHLSQIKEHCNEHIHLKKDSNGFSKIIS